MIAAPPFSVTRATTETDDRWDAFAAGCPGSHHEQSTAWGRYKRAQGWEVVRLVLARDSEIVGGAQVLLRTVKRFLTIGYLARGPLWRADDEPLKDRLIEELHRFVGSRTPAYFVVTPPYLGTGIGRRLSGLGYFVKPYRLPPSGAITATLLIDLAPDEAHLFAALDKSVRRCIRLGQRAGAGVFAGGPDDLELLHRMMCQICARRGVAPRPPDSGTFKDIWRHLGPGGLVRLFLVSCRGEVAAGALIFAFGDTARIWKVGWSGACADARPNHLLSWEVIRWAKNQGYRYVDFMQIIPEHAEKLLRGEEITGDYAGVTRFKLGFGGKVVCPEAPYYRSYRPWLQAALRHGGARLLALRLLAPVLAKLGDLAE